jgi:putative hemolysin
MDMTSQPNQAHEPILSVESIARGARNPIIRNLPRWLLAGVSKFLYENEFNEALDANRDRFGFDWVNGMLKSFNIRVEANHRENVNNCGRAVFVPNHTIGGLDGMAVLSVIGDFHPAARSLSSDFLMAIPNVASFIIPVTTSANKTRDFLIKVKKLYASDEQVLCFAAGRVSRWINGKIIDVSWTKSFIAKAIEHRRSIVPVYIDTLNPPSFYRYQALRAAIKRLTGLSTERFFILRAQYHQTNAVFKINFGKPIPYTVFDDRCDTEEWAQRIRAHVYRMGLLGDQPFDPTIPLQEN